MSNDELQYPLLRIFIDEMGHALTANAHPRALVRTGSRFWTGDEPANKKAPSSRGRLAQVRDGVQRY
jgi:hypothetical protein